MSDRLEPKFNFGDRAACHRSVRADLSRVGGCAQDWAELVDGAPYHAAISYDCPQQCPSSEDSCLLSGSQHLNASMQRHASFCSDIKGCSPPLLVATKGVVQQQRTWP